MLFCLKFLTEARKDYGFLLRCESWD